MDSGFINVHQVLIEQIDLMMRARYPLLYIVTAEEEPLEQVLYAVAAQSTPTRRIIFWDMVRGWSDNGADKGSPMSALLRIGRPEDPHNPKDFDNAIFVMRDLHPYLKLHYPISDKHSSIVRELTSLMRELKRDRKTLILTSYILEIPPELSEEVTVIDFPLPNAPEISSLIRQLVLPEKLKVTWLKPVKD